MRSHITVATTLLKHRLDLGYSQEELGRAAGTKQSRISEIEASKGNPRFDTLDRIASVLGLMIALVPRTSVRPVADSAGFVPVEGYKTVLGANLRSSSGDRILELQT
jgi:transcriptional regulator with XRE-family HTH domain